VSALEIVGVVASAFTVLSFAGNIVQWMRREDLKRLYYSNQFCAYNDYFRLAELLQQCHQTFRKSTEESSIQPEIRDSIEQMIGIADAVRHQILAFTERYLRRGLWRQHVTAPDDLLASREKSRTTPA